MPPLRRAASLLALLLAVLVGGQAVDVLPCGDEGSRTEACADGTTAAVDADCYCHLTFVPATPLAARLHAPLARLAPADAAPFALCDGVAPPFERPPIG